MSLTSHCQLDDNPSMETPSSCVQADRQVCNEVQVHELRRMQIRPDVIKTAFDIDCRRRPKRARSTVPRAPSPLPAGAASEGLTNDEENAVAAIAALGALTET